MQHTPGPWQMDEVRTDSGRAFRIGSGEMLVAGKGCCIIYDDHGSRENQRKANARLIAAAPDMLAALERVLRGDSELSAKTQLAVEQAVAKATGLPIPE